MTSFLEKHGVLTFAVILYFPFIFLGYGIDNDTYAVLESGRLSLEKGTYFPSRHPGYIVHEAASLLLSSVGGSILSNAGTMFMTLLLISSFLKVCRYFSIPNKNFLAILLVVHPLILINATETIDYLWALGLFFFGFVLLLNYHYLLAGLLFGLSIGARLSSFIAVGGVLGFSLFLKQDDNKIHNPKKVILAILSTAVVGSLCYIPSLMYSHWTLEVFKPHMPDNEAWSLKSRVGKLVYKNVYLWGLPAVAVFVYTVYISIKNRGNFLKGHWANLSLLSLIIIMGYEFLFLKFPIQIEYLIPIIPFCLFLIGIGLKNERAILIALIIAVISLNFFNLNLAKPNMPGKATGAKLGVWVDPGLLINETKLRNHFKECSTSKCWQQKFDGMVEN